MCQEPELETKTKYLLCFIVIGCGIHKVLRREGGPDLQGSRPEGGFYFPLEIEALGIFRDREE